MIGLSILSVVLAVGTWAAIRRLESTLDAERDLADYILFVPDDGWRT